MIRRKTRNHPEVPNVGQDAEGYPLCELEGNFTTTILIAFGL